RSRWRTAMDARRRTRSSGFLLFLVPWNLLLVPALPARAGLYDTTGPAVGPGVGKRGAETLPFSRFQGVLASLRSIGVPQPESSLRRHYLKGRDELLARQKAGTTLTGAERIN